MSMQADGQKSAVENTARTAASSSDPLAVLAADWEGFELRFSARELAVVATRLGVGAAGLVPIALIPDDVRSPDSPAFAPIQGALVARAVLVETPDAEFALEGPAGAVLAAAFGAALRITATTVGANSAVRRRWHVRDDMVVTQHLVDPSEVVFGFAPSSPTTVLSGVITECGLPDTRAELAGSLSLDLDRLMRELLTSSMGPDADGGIDSRSWIVADLASMDSTAVAEPGDSNGGGIRLVQRLELDYPSADGLAHRELLWALDEQGDRWMAARDPEGPSAYSTELVRCGGRDVVDGFVSMFPVGGS